MGFPIINSNAKQRPDYQFLIKTACSARSSLCRLCILCLLWLKLLYSQHLTVFSLNSFSLRLH